VVQADARVVGARRNLGPGIHCPPRHLATRLCRLRRQILHPRGRSRQGGRRGSHFSPTNEASRGFSTRRMTWQAEFASPLS
jgi:hypothetical protein